MSYETFSQPPVDLHEPPRGESEPSPTVARHIAAVELEEDWGGTSECDLEEVTDLLGVPPWGWNLRRYARREWSRDFNKAIIRVTVRAYVLQYSHRPEREWLTAIEVGEELGLADGIVKAALREVLDDHGLPAVCCVLRVEGSKRPRHVWGFPGPTRPTQFWDYLLRLLNGSKGDLANQYAYAQLVGRALGVSHDRVGVAAMEAELMAVVRSQRASREEDE